jgi:hypothetical protein
MKNEKLKIKKSKWKLRPSDVFINAVGGNRPTIIDRNSFSVFHFSFFIFNFYFFLSQQPWGNRQFCPWLDILEPTLQRIHLSSLILSS